MADSLNSENENFQTKGSSFDEENIASAFRRTMGFLIDGLIVLIVTTVIIKFFWKAPLAWLNRGFFWIFGMWIWDSIFITAAGTTPGKRLLGIRIYSQKTDGIPEPTQVGLRMIGFWLGTLMLGLGVTPVLFRADGKGWPDVLSDTVALGPSSEEKNVNRKALCGGSLLFYCQTLASIALLGALFATLTIRTWSTVDPEENKYTSSQCENPSLLVKHPQEVLFAITISPAWAACWKKNHFLMGNLKDAQLYKLAEVATDFYWVWTHNQSQWESLFKEVNLLIIQNQERAPSAEGPSKTPPAPAIAATPVKKGKGKSKRHAKVAAAPVTPLPPAVANPPVAMPVIVEAPIYKELNKRLASYQTFYKKFLQAKNRAERIAILSEEVKVPNHPIVTGALSERLWSEQMAEGSITAPFPEHAFKGWREDQACWLTYMDVARPSGCQIAGFAEAIEKFNWLRDNSTSIEEADYIKENFDEEAVPEDFYLAFDLWVSQKKNDLAELKKQKDRFPEISPLHRWADNNASEPKQ